LDSVTRSFGSSSNRPIPNVTFVSGVGYFDNDWNPLRGNQFSRAPGDTDSAFEFGEQNDDGTWAVVRKSTGDMRGLAAVHFAVAENMMEAANSTEISATQLSNTSTTTDNNLVLLRYIQEKMNRDGGNMSHVVKTHTFLGLTIRRTIDITFNGQTFSYKHDSIGDHLVVNSDWLVRDFKIDRSLAEHQVGDHFGSIDDAALAWGLKYFPLSNDSNREYGSNIFSTNVRIAGHAAERFYFGEPNIGTINSVRIPSVPQGKTRVATIHLHPKVLGRANNFSPPDLENMRGRGVPSYLASPNGRVKIADINSRGRTTTSTVFRGIRW
jgi:hypothetical protein